MNFCRVHHDQTVKYELWWYCWKWVCEGNY